MAFWNVNPGTKATERTTLTAESVERQYGTGRGYCVEAKDAREARGIAGRWMMYGGSDGRVEIRERQRVPVLTLISN